jgi:hypothetical protein
MPPDSPLRSPCPECGQEFSARGLASHRRQRHGLVVQAPLPAAAPESKANDILSALELLRGAVARIDERIGEVEASTQHRESPAQELHRLERELALLLVQIGRLQHPANAAEPAAPLPTAELARLRLDQARLVFRIDELKTGAPNAERFLT